MIQIHSITARTTKTSTGRDVMRSLINTAFNNVSFRLNSYRRLTDEQGTEVSAGTWLYYRHERSDVYKFQSAIHIPQSVIE